MAGKLLEGFSGYLHTDGYAGYGGSDSRPDVIQPGGWVHVRRKFDMAGKSCSPGTAKIARQGMELIRELYCLGNQGKEKPPDE
ncbi:MAG: IS66 family transposase [Candidatus Scalindua sp.]|nr:IS66 family transposase [Candidatus Scalindua sp.]